MSASFGGGIKFNLKRGDVKKGNVKDGFHSTFDELTDNEKPDKHKLFKIYTTAEQAVKAEPGIWFKVNPSECTWRVPLRTTLEQVPGGVIHHEWPSIGLGSNQSPQKFEQPVINFSFQAGNIIPYSDRERPSVKNPINVADAKVPLGLGNFYDFLNLLNQPDINSNGSANYVIIEYVSMIFPSLTLQGYFSQEGVQWSDQADNPLGVGNWGASFIMFNSKPSIFSRNELNNSYLQAIFNERVLNFD